MTEPCYRYGLYGGLYTYNGREWVDILRFDIWTQFLNLGVLVLVERLRTYVRTYVRSELCARIFTSEIVLNFFGRTIPDRVGLRKD
jgi:hypothetical protein